MYYIDVKIIMSENDPDNLSLYENGLETKIW